MIVTWNSFPSLAAAVTSCSWTIDLLIVFAVGEVKMKKKMYEVVSLRLSKTGRPPSYNREPPKDGEVGNKCER